MNQSFPLRLCNRLIAILRTARPISCRQTSTLVKSDFTSFFFHNEQWTIAPARQCRVPDRSFRRITHAVSLENLKNKDFDDYREAEKLAPRRLLNIYMQLSKTNLTILNVLTAMSCVALCPLPATVPVL